MNVHVRAARPSDRDAWCELAGRAGVEAEAVWWDTHVGDPNWRLFVAENGRVVGKTAARLVPGQGVQVAPPRIRKGSPVGPVATALLEGTLHLRQEGPYSRFDFKITDRSPDVDQLRRAAEALGFGVAEEQVLVERPLETLRRESMPFATRTLAEVGDDAFFPIFQRADADRTVRPAGYRAEAEWAHLKTLPGFDMQYAILATKGGESLGYAVTNLLPGTEPQSGAISYMGVLPEKRRQGFGRIIHYAALHALRRRGAVMYRDAVDVRNVGMRAVLRRNDCHEVGHEWIYRRALGA
ncbi:MAG: GNAT family N-acetyltransferase [Thermoplasmatota archaeon]